MANMIIRPATGTGNKVIVQDQAGAAVLTTADSGATLGNSTQDNITRLGTVTTGTMNNTIGSSATFPAGHILQTKFTERTTAVTFSNASYYSAGISTTITLIESTSKILIRVFGHSEVNNSTLNAGCDSKITRASGSSESASGTMLYATEWYNYFNRNDYTADTYPAYDVTKFDTPGAGTFTYGMFGRKYAGQYAQWVFAQNNYSGGGHTYGFMVLQEIKQ